MRSMWKTTKSACLEWMVNGKEGLEIKLASLHCGIVWGFEQSTLDQQGDAMKNAVGAVWVWTEHVCSV